MVFHKVFVLFSLNTIPPLGQLVNRPISNLAANLNIRDKHKN